jgi:hypothetical protein
MKAKGKYQKAKGRKIFFFYLKTKKCRPFAFCLLIFAFCFDEVLSAKRNWSAHQSSKLERVGSSPIADSRISFEFRVLRFEKEQLRETQNPKLETISAAVAQGIRAAVS